MTDQEREIDEQKLEKNVEENLTQESENSQTEQSKTFRLFRKKTKKEKPETDSLTVSKRTLTIVGIVILICFSFSAGWFTSRETGYYISASDYNFLQKTLPLRWALDYAYGNYYMDIEYDTLINNAAKGAIGALDPYSTYYTAEEYAEMMNAESGRYVGVGVTVQKAEGGFLITQVEKNSPAAQEGVQAGDLLVEIDGMDVREKSLEEISSFIRGEVNTLVSFTVKRDGNKELTFNMVRSYITYIYAEYDDLSNYDDVNPDIGYIELSSFSGSVIEQFVQAVQQFKADGKKGLILDLRNNGGGSVTILQNIASYLVKNPDGIVATSELMKVRYRNGTENVFRTLDNKYLDVPIIVLVNGGTASASEALLIAMQDYKNVQCIIGTQTYGKGIMQETRMEILGGYAVKLTTATCYSPKGACIHGVGITPDYIVDYAPDDIMGDNQLTLAVQEMEKLLTVG